jgi:light-regulated signal transduction histidine kinase (bacteriophytochrome)/CheY-like chemotaxis protein
VQVFREGSRYRLNSGRTSGATKSWRRKVVQTPNPPHSYSEFKSLADKRRASFSCYPFIYRLARVVKQAVNNRAPQQVSLTTCDSEAIHTLGAIQSFGFLLSVNADWLVVRASHNITDFLNIEHADAIGQSTEACLSSSLLHDIRGRLQVAGGMGVVERLFGQRLSPGGARFDIAVHQSGSEIVLEFEPSGSEPIAPLSVLRTMTARIERQTTLPGVYREVARQVRGLTGFDRVMVYRFDVDGAGEVVAEAANHDLSPFLGLRYPASDIPKQARALYERNYLRIIADVDSDPVAIEPVLLPEGAPLDLSMSTLRSVSPIHIEYLRNMGVKTSMSISILQEGKLWGLIACHHGTAKPINLAIRSTAELFGQMFSYLLDVRQRADESAYDQRVQDIHNRIALAFADPNASLAKMPEFVSSIADFIPAEGIGIYCSGEISLTGLTPTRDEFMQVVKFLNKTASGRVFASHNLSEIFPAAADFVSRAAGILSIPVSRTPRDYLVFFRREMVTTVNWAGEPAKAKAVDEPSARLSPRKSFEAWQETVRNRCDPWSKRDLRAAEALRGTLIEVVLRMSERAHTDMAVAQQSQEIMIAELNHRVRNILGLVRGLVTQSAATAEDIRTFVDGLDHRIGSLARAHNLLSSNDGQPASLHDLLRFEIATYGQLESRLTLAGPDVLLQPNAFTAIALVVHELITNARKYGALSTAAGQVTVTTSRNEIHNIAVTWTESGGPAVTRPARRGFGSTLLEQLVPFEMNGVSKAKFLPQGFVLDLVLPAAVAETVMGSTASVPVSEAALSSVDEAELAKLLLTSLVVEDNLFIALDAEDMLRMLGAKKVVIAKSIAEAQTVIDQETFSFALLDVNLGSDNSLPIARKLTANKIPFAFGTGYGEQVALPGTMPNAPVVSKPYHRAALAKTLMEMINRRRQSDSVTLRK